MHFMRPRIDDPAFETSTGPQALEKGELPSKAFNVTADPISLKTVGQYLNISQQLISLQAGSLQLITNHMTKRVGYAVDKALITELEKSTGTIPLAGGCSGRRGRWRSDLRYVGDVRTRPSFLCVVDGDGSAGVREARWSHRPRGSPALFLSLAAANAIGTATANQFLGSAVAGLGVIVTLAIKNEDICVGNSGAIEGHVLRVFRCSKRSSAGRCLGRQIAVAVALAGYRPVPNWRGAEGPTPDSLRAGSGVMTALVDSPHGGLRPALPVGGRGSWCGPGDGGDGQVSLAP